MMMKYLIWALLLCVISPAGGQYPSNLPSVVPSTQEVEVLPGENVCTQNTIRPEWEETTVSYLCWERVEVDSSHCADHSRPGPRDCYWGQQGDRRHGDRRRGKRGTGCYSMEPKTCQKTVTKLTYRDVVENLCCAGYEVDAFRHCVEIAPSQKCGVNNGGCEHLCVHNWDGTHRCVCLTGYILTDDGRCVDIDECVGNNPCNHRCENTEGGYYCACHPGYSLLNPHYCAETDECVIGNGGCQHDCVNTQGAFYCLCEDGFDLEAGSICKDKDECDLHNGGCSHLCLNEYGYYECDCPENMQLGTDNKTCYTTGTNNPERPLIPGAEASTSDGGHKNFSIAVLIGATCGALALIVIVVLSVCLIRRRSRSRSQESPPPPPPPVAAFVIGEYEDPSLVMKKKGGPGEFSAVGFDNPGYGEKPDTPPPSYSSYCQLEPPEYTDIQPYEQIVARDASTAKYDNAGPGKARGNVKTLKENFEKKTIKLGARLDGQGKCYDNVINEITAIQK